MAYKKHQLYLDDYKIKEGGVIELPHECNWIVRKHIGTGDFIDEEMEKGEICLILNEVRGETSGFWPVMSFLTKEEAGELCKELARYYRGGS